MKKILLAVAMLLLFANPAMANSEMVMIDGRECPVETIAQDNTKYVQLRDLAEGMGADVSWNGVRAIIKTVKRPAIIGNDNFKGLVNRALDLLQAKDPVDYEMVCRNTREITLRPASEMGEVYANSIGLDRFDISSLLIEKPDLSIEFFASALVHESTHSCNCRNFITSIAMNENLAYINQIKTLTILGASEKEIKGTDATRQWVITHSK